MSVKLNDFIAYLEEQARNHSIYVWGAQGQDHTVISESWIKKKETSTKNAQRAIDYWKRQVQAGYGQSLRAFDCSGLGMYFIQNMHALSSGDMSANSMKKKCLSIERKNIKKGDWTFRVYASGTKKGQAYHIGYVVDDSLNVIQAKGRDDGVVKSHITAYGTTFWNAFGRPQYFKGEIEAGGGKGDTANEGGTPATGNWVVSRVLKLVSPMMRGEDVKNLQKALISASRDVKLVADGVFGQNTMQAVEAFQAAKGLARDGKAGKLTVTALGGIWIG